MRLCKCNMTHFTWNMGYILSVSRNLPTSKFVLHVVSFRMAKGFELVVYTGSCIENPWSSSWLCSCIESSSWLVL